VTTQAHHLEQAILARAERLAEEFRERGRRGSDAILREAAEKLRLREQREEGIAKALGERAYRQQVQARELDMQSELDRARWELMRSVKDQLETRMRAHIADEAAYLVTLRGLVDAAVREIDRPELRVRANARDRDLLRRYWAEIQAAAPAGKTLHLDEEPIDTLAGVIVTDADHRLRVDNSFEGRVARLRSRIRQTILERLIPSGFDTGSLFSG